MEEAWNQDGKRETEPGRKFEVGELEFPCRIRYPVSEFLHHIILLVFPKHDLLLVLIQKTVI